jgi:hypothetical protein
VSSLRTGWWLFRRCTNVCSRVNAYADRLAANAACVAGCAFHAGQTGADAELRVFPPDVTDGRAVSSLD